MRLDPPIRERLSAYAELVRSWAPKLDLISDRDLGQLEERHIADSLKALPLLEELPPGPAVDVGSGAGLPGIPLAIAGTRPWRLLEPRRRRSAFLEEVVRELELDCEVLAMTAEEAAGESRLGGAHVFGSARALAAPARALELVRPLVRPGGAVGLWVGEKAQLPSEAEVPVAGLAIVRVED